MAELSHLRFHLLLVLLVALVKQLLVHLHEDLEGIVDETVDGPTAHTHTGGGVRGRVTHKGQGEGPTPISYVLFLQRPTYFLLKCRKIALCQTVLVF